MKIHRITPEFGAGLEWSWLTNHSASVPRVPFGKPQWVAMAHASTAL